MKNTQHQDLMAINKSLQDLSEAIDGVNSTLDQVHLDLISLDTTQHQDLSKISKATKD